MTGMARVCASRLTSCSTCNPSTLGSFRSRRMSRGAWSKVRLENAPRQKRKSSASSPSRTRWIWLASLLLRNACRASSASEELSSTKRISTASGSLKAGLLICDDCRFQWLRTEREVERSAAVDGGLGPNFAAVAMDDALDSRQTNTRPLEILLAMQTLENSEQLIGILGIKAHTVVTHEESRDAAGFLRADLNDGGAASAREFGGIGEKIGKRQSHQSGIAIRFRERFDGPFDAAIAGLLRQVGNHLLDQLLEFYLLADHLPAADAREVQDVVHEMAHVIGGLDDAMDVAKPVFGKPRTLLLLQNSGEAVDVTQGRAKVVRNRIAEGLEFLVHGANLGKLLVQLGI